MAKHARRGQFDAIKESISLFVREPNCSEVEAASASIGVRIWQSNGLTLMTLLIEAIEILHAKGEGFRGGFVRARDREESNSAVPRH